jgi:hypothetical protein
MGRASGELTPDRPHQITRPAVQNARRALFMAVLPLFSNRAAGLFACDRRHHSGVDEERP